MACLLCSLNDPEEEWHTFCRLCVEEHSVDLYSKPLTDTARALNRVWYTLKKAGMSNALTDEELELIRGSIKWQEIKDEIG